MDLEYYQKYVGQKHNLITIIGIVGREGYNIKIQCECSCKNKTVFENSLNSVRFGNTKSCGCLRKSEQEATCQNCKTKFIKRRCDFKGNAKVRFCTRDCQEKYKQTDEYKSHISKVSKERGCGGNVAYPYWLRTGGKEYADKKFEECKKKHSKNNSGKGNPMYGKPSPSKSGTGWKGWYKGWFFRSLRELSFMINVIEKYNFSWVTGESKKLRIPYKHYNGSDRTYAADFILNDRYMVEIKPYRLIGTPLVRKKIKAAMVFCKKNKLIFAITDVEINKDQILCLYEKEIIKLTDKSKILAEEYFYG